MKKCAQCGKAFTSERLFQICCSPNCTRKYFRNHGKFHAEPGKNDVILRSFVCRQCNRDVYVTSKADHRTVFCCQACEKKYWRDVTKHKSRGRDSNQGMSGGMSLGSLIRREHKIDLEIKQEGDILYSFECKYCGKTVDVISGDDKRYKFCCSAHCTMYWSQQKHNNSKRGTNSGMSGGMSLSNLIRRERRDLA